MSKLILMELDEVNNIISLNSISSKGDMRYILKDIMYLNGYNTCIDLKYHNNFSDSIHIGLIENKCEIHLIVSNSESISIDEDNRVQMDFTKFKKYSYEYGSEMYIVYQIIDNGKIIVNLYFYSSNTIGNDIDVIRFKRLNIKDSSVILEKSFFQLSNIIDNHNCLQKPKNLKPKILFLLEKCV